MRRHLLPRLFEAGDVAAHDVAEILRPIQGHPMAKAALEMAVLDAELRGAGVSLAEYLGAVRAEVDCGVSVGIHEDPAQLVEVVGAYLAEGYRRIKLKIEPGHDIEAVRAVRERFPTILLQVDANTAYTLADAAQLAKLDEFDLLLIEQPLAEDDVRGHAELARLVRTPICLDESIISARSAVTSRRAECTTSARRTASRSGAAGCSKPVWVARRTSRWPRFPTSRCP